MYIANRTNNTWKLKLLGYGLIIYIKLEKWRIEFTFQNWRHDIENFVLSYLAHGDTCMDTFIKNKWRAWRDSLDKPKIVWLKIDNYCCPRLNIKLLIMCAISTLCHKSFQFFSFEELIVMYLISSSFHWKSYVNWECEFILTDTLLWLYEFRHQIEGGHHLIIWMHHVGCM